MTRRVYRERVENDIATADASGVAGTPSFFVNGKRPDGAYDIGTLGAAVRAARTRAVAARRHGVMAATRSALPLGR